MNVRVRQQHGEESVDHFKVIVVKWMTQNAVKYVAMIIIK